MQSGRLPGLVAGVREIYATEGVRGFYVGYGTTVARRAVTSHNHHGPDHSLQTLPLRVREVPFAMIQYPLYEELKAQHQTRNPVISARNAALC